MQSRRWITIFFILILVLAAIVYGFMPKPVLIEAVQVQRGPLKVTIEEEGVTQIKERFTVSAPLAGYMRRMQKSVGDRVKKGEILAEIEPLMSDLLDSRRHDQARAVISTAQAMLKVEEEKAAAARADAQYAQRYFERQIKLYKNAVISSEILEQAETAAKRSRAGIAAAEAAVKAAKSELERAQATVHFSPANDASTKSVITTVISPIDGKILHIYRKSEGAVQPGEPLLDLGDPQDLEVRVEALSTDAVRIARGTPVLFQRWGGDYPLAGTVRTVEPAGFTKISSLGVEEQRVPIVIDFTSIDQAARRLGHGFRLEASFTIWEAADVLQVPASALFREQDGWGVFVVKNNRAYKTKVQIGHRNGLAAEIVSGIGEGDMVVSHPDNTIKDAIHVRLQ